MESGIPSVHTPDGSSRVLLHSCCAPCSGAIIECLVKNGIEPVIFFSNSNIAPRGEYDLRREEILRYAELFGLEVVDDEYNHDAWLDYVLRRENGIPCRGLAESPERGERCAACFRFRLLRAARYASYHGISLLATTLASSRWKDLDQVNEAGEWACAQLGGAVSFWAQNWRKGGLQPRRNEIIREQKFYNQNFCGCEFSKKSLPPSAVLPDMK